MVKEREMMAMCNKMYDMTSAVRLEQSLRKSLVKDLQNIIRTFKLLSTELQPSVRGLVKDVDSIDYTSEVSDEDVVKALDMYYMFKDYFNMRRTWINSNCNGFFDYYQIVDEEY